jgi:hypothetical protein
MGYSIMLNTEVAKGSAEVAGTVGHLIIPLTVALAATGIVVPLSNIIDPGILVNSAIHYGIRRQYIASGE